MESEINMWSGSAFINDHTKYCTPAWGKTLNVKDCIIELPIRYQYIIAIYTKPEFNIEDKIPNGDFALQCGKIYLLSKYSHVTKAVIRYMPDVFERSCGMFDQIIKKEYRYYSLN